MKIDYREFYRMAHWGIIGALLLWVAVGFDLQDTQPAIQASIYHAANVTIRAWIGYWIARTALGRLNFNDHPQAMLARAVIIGAVILTAK